MNLQQETDFSTAADIIKSLGLTLNEEYEKKKAFLFEQWSEIAGQSVAKYSYPDKLTEEGVLIIKCKNSVVANEIFNLRTKINEEFRKRAKIINLGCFKYIKVTYYR